MRQYQLAIVEDEPHTARYIQGIVEATNLFHIAAVCESAEELLTLEPFPDLDVLVTDVKMSGLTGLELLRARSRGGSSRPPCRSCALSLSAATIRLNTRAMPSG